MLKCNTFAVSFLSFMVAKMKVYKTEIELNDKQRFEYFKTIGVCRFMYNFYLQKNNEIKDREDNNFMSDYDFIIWFNKDFLPQNPEYKWVKEVSGKAVSRTLREAYLAYKRFFNGKGNHPKFKKKGRDICSVYFVRNHISHKIRCERHRIKIPVFGWCKIKEYGYLPLDGSIISGRITYKANKFFISVLSNQDVFYKENNVNNGIGIDLGIKHFAICSDGAVYDLPDISKEEDRIKKINRTMCKQSKGSKNFLKNKIKLQKIYLKIQNTRNDAQNKIIESIINKKPKFITIEKLQVEEMLKNRILSHSLQKQSFYAFSQKLKNKCLENGIELRQVSQYFPSSKTCSECGCIDRELQLKDRIFKCKECGAIIDRDLNASINLRNCKSYEIII